MCFKGAVDGDATGGHVSGERELNDGALRRHVSKAEALCRYKINCSLIDLDPGQHLLMTNAAAGIGIGLGNQLIDRQRTIADDMSRHPLGDRSDLAVDHQASVVPSGDISLDNDQSASRLRLGSVKRAAYVGIAAQVEHDATTMVAVERFQDHGVADAVRQPDRLIDRAHRL